MATASDAQWQSAARALVERGAVDEAVTLLQAVAAGGCVGATVELARLKWRRGHFDEAAALMKSAEAAVQGDDIEGHWDLHLAYAIGLGPEDRSERLKLSFDHLRHAAQIGQRPRDLLAVALHFRDGLNEVPPSQDEAKKWVELAAATGDSEAARMLRAFSRSRK